MRAYYARVAREHGGLDILVNLAGGFAGGQPVHETPWSLWQQQLDINLKTAVLSCAAAVPHLLARGGGAIVNVGTRTATQPAASPRGLRRVQARRPPAHRGPGRGAARRQRHRQRHSPQRHRHPGQPARQSGYDYSRWVKPEEIARVILFLVGPDARVISGAAVPVYGRA